jgi:hypothetical protein
MRECMLHVQASVSDRIHFTLHSRVCAFYGYVRFGSPALRLQGNRLSAHAAPMPLRMTRARLTRAHEHARLDRKHRELELAS